MVCEVDATVEEVHKALRKTMATVRSAKFAAGGAKGASPLVKSLLVLAKARGAEDAAVPALLDAITYITKVGTLPYHPATAAPRCRPAAAAPPPPPLAASQAGAVALTARSACPQNVKGVALVVRLENGVPLLCGLTAAARERPSLLAAG